jgi:hypothetical protein
MKKHRKLIGAAILLAVVVAFAAVTFGGVFSLPGSSSDVAVLWRDSVVRPPVDTDVLWRDSVTPPPVDVAVLWRDSVTLPLLDVAVL